MCRRPRYTPCLRMSRQTKKSELACHAGVHSQNVEVPALQRAAVVDCQPGGRVPSARGRNTVREHESAPPRRYSPTLEPWKSRARAWSQHLQTHLTCRPGSSSIRLRRRCWRRKYRAACSTVAHGRRGCDERHEPPGKAARHPASSAACTVITCLYQPTNTLRPDAVSRPDTTTRR